MSSTATVAQGYKFITEPADELKCLLCSKVAKEPLQHAVCGILFCKECIETYGKDKPCLRCEQESHFFKDGRARRVIQSLLVKCTNMMDGTSCDWEGPFAALEMHLDECEFVLVPCPRQCEEKFVRKDLTEHLINYCPYRAWECNQCGEAGKYSDIAQFHSQVCPMDTLKCPIAGCAEVLQRQHLARHLATCEHALVSCKYRNIGCEAKLKRIDVSKHGEESEEAHLRMALGKIVELQDSYSSLISSYAQLTDAVARMNDSLVALKSMVIELDAYGRDMEGLTLLGNHESATLGMQIESLLLNFNKSKAYTFRMTNCKSFMESGQVFTSEPFYTIPGHPSYHMVIEVQLKGGAEPSCASIHAALVGGNFDHELSWPFVGELGFLLLNQHCNSSHRYETLSITAEDDMRVGSLPWGIADFVPHHELYHDPDDDFKDPEVDTIAPKEIRQYLKDDTLYFQISINQAKYWLCCSE